MLALAFLLAVRIAPPVPEVAFRQPVMAVDHDTVALAFGAGSDIHVATSRDSARSFSGPVPIPTGGKLALGRHRGPRIVFAGKSLVVAAIVNGDLMAWRSTDQGKTWSKPARVNDEPNAAREGLHALAAAPDGTLHASWLDLREGKMALYGAKSSSGGAAWEKNTVVYRSPDGFICTCCHPSLMVGAGGDVYAMWRNALGGSRDMYLGVSKDGGKTFQEQKLGEGTWPLNACPMDGGGIAFENGKVVSAWRRDGTVYLAKPGAAEKALGTGKDPAIATGPDGSYVAWTTPRGLQLQRPGGAAPETLSPEGGFVTLAGGDRVYAAWESNGSVYVQAVDAPGATH